MATTIKCDLCRGVISDPDANQYGAAIKVTMLDGVHPHNGSIMTKTVDCCVRCAQKIPDLRSDTEWTAHRR